MQSKIMLPVVPGVSARNKRREKYIALVFGTLPTTDLNSGLVRSLPKVEMTRGARLGRDDMMTQSKYTGRDARRYHAMQSKYTGRDARHYHEQIHNPNSFCRGSRF